MQRANNIDGAFKKQRLPCATHQTFEIVEEMDHLLKSNDFSRNEPNSDRKFI